MVRNYTRKCSKAYTDDDLREAIIKVRKKKLTFTRAVKEYNIPRSTLSENMKRLQGQHASVIELRNTVGRPPVLSRSEEEYIAHSLVCLADNGHPQGRSKLQDLVQVYVKTTGRLNDFKDGRPGYDWILGFERRQKHIVIRISVKDFDVIPTKSIKEVLNSDIACLATKLDRQKAKKKKLRLPLVSEVVTSSTSNRHGDCSNKGAMVYVGATEVKQ